MKKTLTLTAICALIALFSCTKPSGVEVTEYFSVPDNYYSLYVSDGMEVTVTDQVDQVVITADENVMQKVKVTCKNGRLRIVRSDFSLYRLMKAEVLIPYNSHLHQLDVEMNSSFTTPYGLEGEEITIIGNYYSDIDIPYILTNKLSLKLEYHSDFEGDIDVMDHMDLIMSDSDAKLTGAAAELRLDMSSDSEIVEQWYNGYYAFECDYCYGTMNQKCKAHLHCNDEMAVVLTDNSFLHCTGEPIIDECEWDETSLIIFE